MENPKRKIRFDVPVEFPCLTLLRGEKIAFQLQVQWKDIFSVRAVISEDELEMRDCSWLKLRNGDEYKVLMPYRILGTLVLKYHEWYSNETNKYRFYLPIH